MNKEGMTNGFTIRSWSDITSLILIVTFLISGLIWGMKLEARYDYLDEETEKLSRQVGNGILPRAEERIRQLERRMAILEQAHKPDNEH